MKCSSPAIARTRLNTKKFSLLKIACGVLVFCLAAAIASEAQVTFSALANFDGSNGANPEAGLIQATDGNFYGTTTSSVFKVTSGGSLTTLYFFCTVSGCGTLPSALVQAPNGNFYGTTLAGGNNCSFLGSGPNCGTVFSMTPSGALTTLYNFCPQAPACDTGAVPGAGLVLGSDGNLYGTTQQGGTIASCYQCGTVFKMTPGGTLTTLHSFDGTDGANPTASLVPIRLYFYGTTLNGGLLSTCSNSGCGTVFLMTYAGAVTVLHAFNGADGSNPKAELVRGSDGNYYGTTESGGASNCQGAKTACGTVFKITPGGTLTTLHSFDGTDGATPSAGLVQATDGNFYGATQAGGANCPANPSYGCGTIFRITPKGELTLLHTFAGPEGARPFAALLQGTDGDFYGTTASGGSSSGCNGGCGTIFKLSVGLGPFVSSQTYSGKVGANVIILGNNLTGSTAVSFNGTAATFNVVSASEITTAVPAGATTGDIKVTTPTATLTSNTPFYVTPQLLSFTPASGPVGTQVKITGVSLTQTNIVTFGGVAATSFTVNSDTQITATVPTGAETGRVSLSTLGGVSWSSTNFTVE